MKNIKKKVCGVFFCAVKCYISQTKLILFLKGPFCFRKGAPSAGGSLGPISALPMLILQGG